MAQRLEVHRQIVHNWMLKDVDVVAATQEMVHLRTKFVATATVVRLNMTMVATPSRLNMTKFNFFLNNILFNFFLSLSFFIIIKIVNTKNKSPIT
jgi:hypothetical protein